MRYSHKLIHTSTLNKVICQVLLSGMGGGGGGVRTENNYFGINHFISSFAITAITYDLHTLTDSGVVLSAHIQTNFVQST